MLQNLAIRRGAESNRLRDESKVQTTITQFWQHHNLSIKEKVWKISVFISCNSTRPIQNFHLNEAVNATLTSIYHSCLLNNQLHFSFHTIQLSSLTSRTLLLCKGGTTKTRTAAAIILIKHEIWTQIASKRHSDRYPNTLSKFLASTRTLCYCSETSNRDGVFVPHGN